MDLSWPGGHRTYQRGDTYAYQAAITGLEARAAEFRANALADRARSELAAFIEILTAVETNSAEAQANLKDAGERYEKLYKRLHNRQRAASSLRSLGLNDALAWQTEQEVSSLEREIWRLDRDVERIHRQFSVLFEKAASLASTIQTHCADEGDSSLQDLCAGFQIRDESLSEQKRNLRAAFDDLEDAVSTASVDVPPAKRLLKKIASD